MTTPLEKPGGPTALDPAVRAVLEEAGRQGPWWTPRMPFDELDATHQAAIVHAVNTYAAREARIAEAEDLNALYKVRTERDAARLATLEAENDMLRGIVAKIMPCHYCGVEEIAKCPSGFPGCALGDDLFVASERQDAHLRARVGTLEAELATGRAAHEALLYQYNACHDDKARLDAQLAQARAVVDAASDLIATGGDIVTFGHGPARCEVCGQWASKEAPLAVLHAPDCDVAALKTLIAAARALDATDPSRAAQLQTELEEARKLISPEVQRVAALLMRRVDRHSDACCLKCSEGLAERDAARAEVARLEAGIRNYCMPGCPMRDKIG